MSSDKLVLGVILLLLSEQCWETTSTDPLRSEYFKKIYTERILNFTPRNYMKSTFCNLCTIMPIIKFVHLYALFVYDAIRF